MVGVRSVGSIEKIWLKLHENTCNYYCAVIWLISCEREETITALSWYRSDHIATSAVFRILFLSRCSQPVSNFVAAILNAKLPGTGPGAASSPSPRQTSTAWQKRFGWRLQIQGRATKCVGDRPRLPQSGCQSRTQCRRACRQHPSAYQLMPRQDRVRISWENTGRGL